MSEVLASSTPPSVYIHSFSSLRVDETLEIKLSKTGHGVSAYKSPLLWSDQHRSHESRHTLNYCPNQSLERDTIKIVVNKPNFLQYLQYSVSDNNSFIFSSL